MTKVRCPLWTERQWAPVFARELVARRTRYNPLFGLRVVLRGLIEKRQREERRSIRTVVLAVLGVSAVPALHFALCLCFGF